MGVLKVWDGTAWQSVSYTLDTGDAFVGPNAPAGTPVAGDLWWDSDDVTPGITTPLGVTDGGTGATSPATARSSLGVAGIGNSTTTAGAPTAGTWARGDTHLDSTGALYICATAGAPGVWRMIPRTYSEGYNHTGAFTTGSYSFASPAYKSDLVGMVAMTFFAGTTGVHAYGIRIDGVDLAWWAQVFVNAINTHLTVCVPVTFRGLAPGTHTVTYVVKQGSPTSDVNDQARWFVTFTEVP